MSLLQKIKEKFTIAKKVKTLDEPLYMLDGAAVICLDKNDKVTASTKIVAEHVENPDTDFPKFVVIKTASRNGIIGMFNKVALILDTDEEPVIGSKNLMTSGDIFKVVSDLQDQIDDLRFLIKQ